MEEEDPVFRRMVESARTDAMGERAEDLQREALENEAAQLRAEGRLILYGFYSVAKVLVVSFSAVITASVLVAMVINDALGQELLVDTFESGLYTYWPLWLAMLVIGVAKHYPQQVQKRVEEKTAKLIQNLIDP